LAGSQRGGGEGEGVKWRRAASKLCHGLIAPKTNGPHRAFKIVIKRKHKRESFYSPRFVHFFSFSDFSTSVFYFSSFLGLFAIFFIIYIGSGPFMMFKTRRKMQVAQYL